MKLTRYGAAAAAAGLIVGLAGALGFARTPEPVTIETAANAVRGPGIPPPPDASQNAPPNPNPQASTPNLAKVANALHLNHKSVTVVVTLPAGLGLTNRVDVSVLFGTGAQSKRITQGYNNASGNRVAYDFPANDGQRRREEVTISLLEALGNGDFAPAAVRSTVDLEPLYDISLGHFHAYLYNDCDNVGDSEPHIYWTHADGQRRNAELSMSAGDDVPVPNFARTFTEVGQLANLKMPTFIVYEEDPELGFHNGGQPPLVTPLLPGRTRTVEFTTSARNDRSCNVKLDYRITYTLRQYPNL